MREQKAKESISDAFSLVPSNVFHLFGEIYNLCSMFWVYHAAQLLLHHNGPVQCWAVLADTPLECSVEVGDSACGVADYGGGSHFKKGGWRVCSNYRDITWLSLPRKVYPRVLERRIRPIQEE